VGFEQTGLFHKAFSKWLRTSSKEPFLRRKNPKFELCNRLLHKWPHPPPHLPFWMLIAGIETCPFPACWKCDRKPLKCPRKMVGNSFWIAQRHGQDWNDIESIAAIEWMVAQVPSTEWQVRLDRVRDTFFSARDHWAAGDRIALFDPVDLIAWYIFQWDRLRRGE